MFPVLLSVQMFIMLGWLILVIFLVALDKKHNFQLEENCLPLILTVTRTEKHYKKKQKRGTLPNFTFEIEVTPVTKTSM